jgi:hypothetical protein
MKKLSLTLCTFLLGGLLAAQQPATSTDPNGNTESARTTDRANNKDYGWIGLLGLAGLAGLMRKRDDVRGGMEEDRTRTVEDIRRRA